MFSNGRNIIAPITIAMTNSIKVKPSLPTLTPFPPLPRGEGENLALALWERALSHKFFFNDKSGEGI
jgi:hypothetical protein